MSVARPIHEAFHLSSHLVGRAIVLDVRLAIVELQNSHTYSRVSLNLRKFFMSRDCYTVTGSDGQNPGTRFAEFADFVWFV